MSLENYYTKSEDIENGIIRPKPLIIQKKRKFNHNKDAMKISDYPTFVKQLPIGWQKNISKILNGKEITQEIIDKLQILKNKYEMTKYYCKPLNKKKLTKEQRAKRMYRKVYMTSSIETKIQNALAKNNILFTKHKLILDIEHFYVCDIFIEPNIVIEIDGCYWHDCPICFPNGGRNTEKYNSIDKIRTKEMREQGYAVLRIWEHEINDDINKCIQKIQLTIKQNIVNSEPISIQSIKMEIYIIQYKLYHTIYTFYSRTTL